MPSHYLTLLIASGCASTIAAMLLWLTSLLVAPPALRYRVLGARLVVGAHLLTVCALLLVEVMQPSPSPTAASAGVSQKAARLARVISAGVSAAVVLVVFGTVPVLVARSLSRRAKRPPGGTLDP
jgi:hypothetical protein